ncbi:MAG TPA: hypothetical protein VIS51_11975 [Solirubrobacterales bacterium]
MKVRDRVANGFAAAFPSADQVEPSSDGEYHRSVQIDERQNWLDVAAAAQHVRVAGTAFCLELRCDLDPVALSPKTLKRLRRKASKALRSELGSDYQLESLQAGSQGILIEVSANTSYSRTRSFLIGSHPPWPDKIDRAMESMRRTVRDALRSRVDPAIGVTASWGPGRGVFAEEVNLSEDPPLAAIRDTLRERGDLKTRLEFGRWILLVLAVLFGLAVPTLIFFLDQPVMAGYSGFFALYFLAFLPMVNGRLAGVRGEIAEVKERLELRGLFNEEERRAFRLYQLHNLDLKRYYDLALSQRRVIFGLGGFCITLGAGVAITALILVGDGGTSKEQNLLIAGIGAVGAILANFVAVIYLRMFSDTVKSMDTFHDRLVATHHLLFGNLLAARIADREKRDKTLADMAASVAHLDLEGKEDHSSSNGKAEAKVQRTIP